MTVMDPRPWSPAGPHIGPDEDDLLLLDPTGDAEDDLGSAVLAVHRVGAAAAEAVARAPLPDEFRLIDALAAARSAFAARAVDAVSKCVDSDNPRGYADLLLRDLFDAGETGAVSVYRACVSKGVAPPLAAQRAGLVYGVGSGELGRYLSIATDPKAHPVAIADAADRAVTRWASGVVRDEVATSEEVAKQTLHQSLQDYNVTPFGQEHPKGQQGRFVTTLERPTMVAAPPTSDQIAGQSVGLLARLRRDTGVGYQAAPEVAGAPAPPVTAPPVAPRPRVQRRQRMQRQQRTVSTPAAVSQAKVKASLRSRVSAQLAPKVRARLDAQRTAHTGEGQLGERIETSHEFTTDIDRYLAWSASSALADEIFHSAKGAGTHASPKTVQMGQLQSVLREPVEWGRGQHNEHQQRMGRIAEEAAGDDRPRFVHITGEELEDANVRIDPSSPKQAEAAVREYAQRSGYYGQLAREPDGSYNPMLAGLISTTPSADPGTGDWFLVLNPEPVVYSRPEDSPLAVAAELVIDPASGGPVRGNINRSGEAIHYELDPAQDYIVEEPVELWKQTGPESGYWVQRYTLVPVENWDEGEKRMSKAVNTEQRWRTEPRNAVGEWSRTGGGLLTRVKEAPTVVTPVVTPIGPRMQRRQRVQRKTRTVPVASSVAQVNAKVHAVLPARLLHAFHAGLSADESYEVIDTSVPAWDDRQRYVVYSADDWDHLLRQSGWDGFRNEVVPKVPLSSSAQSHFMNRMQDAVVGDDADVEVRMHAENEIMERHRDERRELHSLRFHIDDDDEHAGMKWTEVGKRIRNAMAVDQTVQSVRIDPGRYPGDYRVMANRHPLSDVVVVVLPDDFDPDRPITMQFTGRARQSALNRNIDRYYDEALHVDAPVQMFRATQATQQVYHARQDEQ